MSRTAPPVHVLVDRFSAWTISWGVLWVFAACGLAAWFAGWPQSASLQSGDRAQWFALFFMVALLLPGLWCFRLSAVSLRWDGEQWWLGLPSDVGIEPWLVHPLVRLDLGAWMLLQLEPGGAGARLTSRYRWLPIQRRGLTTQWHGLRCALLAHQQQQHQQRRGLS